MANYKITDLTAITSLTDDDLLVVVDDAAGTPVTRKITKANALSGYAKTTDLPDVTGKADKTNVLELNNVTAFTPDADYEPATKKYVDDNAGGVGDMAKATYDPTNINASAFNTDNHTNGTTNKVFTATEQSKLSNIEANANNYSHPATHSADIITDGTTNKAYTATEQSKLSGVEAGAEVNVQPDWNAISGDALILNKPTIPAAGMTNPMTASGDVIYGGTAGAPTALAKGTDGQVLGLVSGLPAWSTPAGGGGPFKTATPSGVNEFTISGLDLQAHKGYRIDFTLNWNSGGGDYLWIRLNGADQSAITWNRLTYNTSGTVTAANDTAKAKFELSASTLYAYTISGYLILSYTDSGGGIATNLSGQYWMYNKDTANSMIMFNGAWASATNVTSLLFKSGFSSSFKSGFVGLSKII